MRYFKVLNKDMNHHNFQYVEGLNKDTIPFREKGLCVPGGLHFTVSKYIYDFYEYGIYVCEVTLPTNEKDFKIVQVSVDKFKANMIILGKPYSLFDDDTFKILRLPIPSTQTLFKLVAKYKQTDMLSKIFINRSLGITYIDLSKYDIINIPYEIIALRNLQTLRINYKQFPTIPPKLWLLPDLQIIIV